MSDATPQTADAAALLGTWHLLQPPAGSAGPAEHYMDLVFSDVDGRLHGVMRSRINSVAVPLAQITFDGLSLTFQSASAPGRPQADMPTMVMFAIGDGFEGQWTLKGKAFGAMHKLVRAARPPV
jgi:hypothetical protein